MTARYPNAIAASALAHAAIVGLAFLATFLAQRHLREPIRTIELVGGLGENYDALQAPALGDPTVKMPNESAVRMPSPPVPQPVPEPVRQQNPVTPPQAKAAPVPQPKAPAPTVQKTVAPPQTISFEQFKSTTKTTKSAPAPKQQVPAVKKVGEGIAQGMAGGSTANKVGGAGGSAVSREVAEAMVRYWSVVKVRLKEKMVVPTAWSDTLHATVRIRIAAGGQVSNPRIVKSSNHAGFDQAVLHAARQLTMGPRADGKSDDSDVEIFLRDISRD